MASGGTSLPGSNTCRLTVPPETFFSCSETQGMVSPSATRLEPKAMGMPQRTFSCAMVGEARQANEAAIARVLREGCIVEVSMGSEQAKFYRRGVFPPLGRSGGKKGAAAPGSSPADGPEAVQQVDPGGPPEREWGLSRHGFCNVGRQAAGASWANVSRPWQAWVECSWGWG